jgi:hypothetical protein
MLKRSVGPGNLSRRINVPVDWLPVFIGGFRSGSTLLINLLGLHPEVEAWFETKAFCEALRWQRVLRLPDQREFEAALLGLPARQAFVADAVAARMAADFRRTAARQLGEVASGKASYERYPLGFDRTHYALEDAEFALAQWLETTRAASRAEVVARATGRLITTLGARASLRRPHWINKTPEITRFGDELDEALGPTRRVLLIRHGHQVAASARHLGWASTRELARWWRGLIVLSRATAGAVPERYLELRYEDLVRDPAATLDRLLAFTGLAGEGHALVEAYCDAVGAGSFDRIREARGWQLPPDEQAIFDAVAGDLLADLGYR